jgi:hypothetical protein
VFPSLLELGETFAPPAISPIRLPRGECFCCSHEHGTGVRCRAVSYLPEFFERLSADAGGGGWLLGVARVPPIRAVAPRRRSVNRCPPESKTEKRVIYNTGILGLLR